MNTSNLTGQFLLGEAFVDERRRDWATPYRFTGKEQDCETGLYYYGARYYDPIVGRFLAIDPIADKFWWVTPYNYAENNVPTSLDLWVPQAAEPENKKPFPNQQVQDGVKAILDGLYKGYTYVASVLKDGNSKDHDNNDGSHQASGYFIHSSTGRFGQNTSSDEVQGYIDVEAILAAAGSKTSVQKGFVKRGAAQAEDVAQILSEGAMHTKHLVDDYNKVMKATKETIKMVQDKQPKDVIIIKHVEGVHEHGRRWSRTVTVPKTESEAPKP